jgi:mono/diheme cytochrome c family protein
MRARRRAGQVGAALFVLALPACGALADDEAVTRGRLLYMQNCSHCHGPNMISPGTMSYDLRRFPDDQPERFRNSVWNGKGNMPAWRGVLHTEEIDLLWRYVRSRGRP